MNTPEIRSIALYLCRADTLYDFHQRPPQQWLIDSVKTCGILSPITGFYDNNTLCIVAGFRRFHSAQITGLSHIPVRILSADCTQENILEYALHLARDDNGLPLHATLRLVIAAHRLCREPRAWLSRHTHCLPTPIRGDVYADLLRLSHAPRSFLTYIATYDAPLTIANALTLLPEAFLTHLVEWALSTHVRPVELRTITDTLISRAHSRGITPHDVWIQLFPADKPSPSRAHARRVFAEEARTATHTFTPVGPRLNHTTPLHATPLDRYTHIYAIDITENDAIAHAICQRASHLPVTHITEHDFTALCADMTMQEQEGILALTTFPGDYIKPCPGTRPPGRCCGYSIFSPVVNCPLGCAYCILQSYLNTHVTMVYTDAIRALDMLRSNLATGNQKLVRVGTGELGDSLVLESWTHHAAQLIDATAALPNCLLELKTKTADISLIEELPAHNRCVLAWSLNPQAIISHEEGYAAPLHQRLAAARRAAERGFLVAFHCDPIIAWENAESLYHDLAHEIVEAVPADAIAWISLGCLRYPKNLPPRAQRRHPDSRIFATPMELCPDEKLRYPVAQRRALYTAILSVLQAKIPDVFTYLCMETPDVWDAVMPWTPTSNAAFDARFTAHCCSRFPWLNQQS